MKPNDLKPTALPEELIRCYEEKQDDGTVLKVSLMYRREVPQFDTPFFNQCMMNYNNWKLFQSSPPNGMGWAHERNVTCEIFRVLETESNRYDAWEYELERNKRS